MRSPQQGEKSKNRRTEKIEELSDAGPEVESEMEETQDSKKNKTRGL